MFTHPSPNFCLYPPNFKFLEIPLVGSMWAHDHKRQVIQCNERLVGAWGSCNIYNKLWNWYGNCTAVFNMTQAMQPTGSLGVYFHHEWLKITEYGQCLFLWSRQPYRNLHPEISEDKLQTCVPWHNSYHNSAWCRYKVLFERVIIISFFPKIMHIILV